MDEDDLAALVFSHLLEALQVAVSTVQLVDLPTQSTLRRLVELQQALGDLEVSTVMLLNRMGVTWEEMATVLGVRRQSLNRRLSRRVVQHEGVELSISGLEKEWLTWLKRLGEEIEETENMKPRQIAHRRARRILSGTEVPGILSERRMNAHE
jgi:hypothetical protein